MKRITKLLFAIVVLFTAIHSTEAAQIEKIAVFPVNIQTHGDVQSIYPNTLSLISNDIVNTLTKSANISVMDINSSENQINSLNLSKDYKKFLEQYKNTYTLDYNACSLIAKKLGVTKVLLVSGGYDLQNLMLKRSLLYRFDIPGAPPLVPSYRLNITLSLLDPESGIILWENTYKKDLEMTNFAIPSQFFGENVIPIEKLKTFSYDLSEKATIQILNLLSQSAVTEVNSSIISTDNAAVVEKVSPESSSTTTKTTDGSMTTDGHSYSTDSDYLLNYRKQKYKNWMKKNLP